MPFTRDLDRGFIEELNKLYKDRASWWRALVEDESVFIAIRNNAINAYAGGASIARIEWSNGLKLRVNRKFLILLKSADGNDPYLDLLAPAGPPVEAITVNDSSQYVEHLGAIKAAARRLAGTERSGETDLAASCPCVLDVEAAFNSAGAGPDSEEPIGSVGRIDIVAINDRGQLTLTEAKLYSNGELRSRTEPVVCTQLVEYYNWARDHEADIIAAYSQVLAYRRDLGLTSEPLPQIAGLDVTPRLLIFGFDKAQKSLLADISQRIISGVKDRILNFTEKQIRTVGGPSSLRAHHLQ